MTIPYLLEEIIEQANQEVENNSKHHLGEHQMVPLYRAFGPSNYLQRNYPVDESLDLKHLTEADRARIWLNIITSKHVLPIWSRFENRVFLDRQTKPQPTLPFDILQTAEAILNGEKTLNEGHSAYHGYFYYDLGDLRLLGVNSFSYGVACVAFAASNALHSILASGDIFGDSVGPAEKAYSTIIDEENIRYNKPPTYHPHKRLEFWQWWLNIAIPEAFELATKDN